MLAVHLLLAWAVGTLAIAATLTWGGSLWLGLGAYSLAGSLGLMASGLAMARFASPVGEQRHNGQL